MKYKEISVVLPAFNEQENILKAVADANKYLKSRFLRYEIIVVDDGSRDNTEVMVKKIMRTNPRVKLVTHRHNLGYGAALRSGFGKAKYDWVFYTDSDNQFVIDDMDKLLPLVSKYDIVAGYRLNRQDPVMRIFIAWVYNLFIRSVFGLKIRDVDCSFKLYKRKVFKTISMECETGLIDAEILVKARKAGLTIGQAGVRHLPRSAGKTMYEVGHRNKFWAFVRPQVVIDLIREMRMLRRRLNQKD